MGKWEYAVSWFSYDTATRMEWVNWEGERIEGSEEILNRFGEDGWELVSFTYRPLVNVGGINTNVGSDRGPSVAVFKRPRD